ncbi:MAG: serine/threonine protein kinase [Rubrivivax sp.]|nr:serine/threonine protein kinase [Rubrivivax sp.]
MNALPAGTTIADHVLLKQVGLGRQGVVFRAQHLPTGTLRALKLTTARPEEPSPQPILRLEHPHIVKTWDSGRQAGWDWVATEWIAGHDLTRYAHRDRLLPEALAVDVAFKLAQALDHAHRLGITHRDLKPANVRIHLPLGVVKLLDFDIARHADASASVSGVFKGTPAYMAPEQLAGAHPSASSDLYALGAVLYELLCGRRPHEATTLGELLQRMSRQPAPRLRDTRADLPAALDELLADLLCADPARRPSSAQEVAARLQHVLRP